MDVIDDAQAANETFQAAVLEMQQRNREPANYTGSDCVDCGDEIPLKRREAQKGCCRCVDCQARAERSRSEEFELHENWRPL